MHRHLNKRICAPRAFRILLWLTHEAEPMNSRRPEWLAELLPDYFEDTKQADVEARRQRELLERDGTDRKRVKTEELVQLVYHF